MQRMDGVEVPVESTDVAPPVSGPAPRPVATRADPDGQTGSRMRSSRRATVVWALKVSIVPWVAARLVVGAALAIAHQVASTDHVSAAAAARVHSGLLGWDAGWYESIARLGYAGAGHASLRFFPFFPLLVRGLSEVPGIGVGASAVVVANACALAGTAVLVALVRYETGDEDRAGRAAWLICLAPAAFTFVMGYAEGTLLVLAAGTLFALRTRRWWWAVPLGLAAGLTRPIGALLLFAAAVEAWRGLRSSPAGERLARAAAVAAPVVGSGAFLGWVGWRYGDALAPLRLQEEGGHHGHLVDPLVTLAQDASFLAHGHHLGEGLHLPWVLLALVLLVVSFRSWPASYGVFAAAVLVVALTGSNLDSFERYALSAFPLVLAGVTLTGSEKVLRVVLVLSAAGLVGYALLAFTNLYVP
jgi:hypothetical protein